MTRFIPLMLASALVLAAPGPSHAQVTDLTPADRAIFAVEVTKPFFSEGDFGFTTSTILGRTLIPVGERVWFQGDLGLSVASWGDESGAALSNATVGVVLANASEWPLARFAVSLPTSRDFGEEGLARVTGIYADPHGWERFIDDAWSIHGLLTPGAQLPDGSLGLRVGGSAYFPEEGGDPEFYGRYGAYLTREVSRVRLGVELLGLAWLSQPDLSFSERTVHQLTASVGLARAAASPDLFVRLPLDDDFDEAVMVGIRLTF